MQLNVAGGSLAAQKLVAIRTGFEACWPYPYETLEVRGFQVESGVSEQPLSESEAKAGATRRAVAALQSWNEADFGVGLEGGVKTDETDGSRMGFGIVAVVDQRGSLGYGTTVGFLLPTTWHHFLDQGQTLGEISKRELPAEYATHRASYFGALTNGSIDRTTAYAAAVQAALGRFVQPWLFTGAHIRH